MDVDFSHPHSLLPLMVSRINGGADVVIGWCYARGGGTPDWPVHRRMRSRYGNRYTRRLLRLAVSDPTWGPRAYRAPSLERIRVDTTRANGCGFMLEAVRRMTGIAIRYPRAAQTVRTSPTGHCLSDLATRLS